MSIESKNYDEVAVAVNEIMLGVDISRIVAAYVVWVTPDVAATWVKRRHPEKQRDIRESRIKRWLTAMNAGKWIEDSEPICFDLHGNLVQGQHRLLAIIKHGKPIKMLVLLGLTEKAIEGMDRGDGRSKADRGHASGALEKDENAKWASIAATLVKIDMGLGYRSYDDEDLDYLVDYKQSIREIWKHCPKKGPCSSCAVTAALVYLHRLYPAESVSFARKIAGTEPKIANDPADKLLSGMPKGVKSDLQIQYTFTAFEKHLAGAPMQRWPAEMSAAMVRFRKETNDSE
jgi:hypothetical protein